ncbi:putative Myo-inositol monophosphatase A3 [Blattamonas nauphoetae]|uniref:3'(2'),5'-bisphosphate nucleotidase 1 n=1 Tax=Blattamonas nauphoetae TaxID=2049346 RepID=A0ABQ9XC31_9EUKA|nr:putative Myo-inositol monophosphatase A3 [Blattamonas nauphoetae]
MNVFSCGFSLRLLKWKGFHWLLEHAFDSSKMEFDMEIYHFLLSYLGACPIINNLHQRFAETLLNTIISPLKERLIPVYDAETGFYTLSSTLSNYFLRTLLSLVMSLPHRQCRTSPNPLFPLILSKDPTLFHNVILLFSSYAVFRAEFSTQMLDTELPFTQDQDGNAVKHTIATILLHFIFFRSDISPSVVGLFLQKHPNRTITSWDLVLPPSSYFHTPVGLSSLSIFCSRQSYFPLRAFNIWRTPIPERLSEYLRSSVSDLQTFVCGIISSLDNILYWRDCEGSVRFVDAVLIEAEKIDLKQDQLLVKDRLLVQSAVQSMKWILYTNNQVLANLIAKTLLLPREDFWTTLFHRRSRLINSPDTAFRTFLNFSLSSADTIAWMRRTGLTLLVLTDLQNHPPYMNVSSVLAHTPSFLSHSSMDMDDGTTIESERTKQDAHDLRNDWDAAILEEGISDLKEQPPAISFFFYQSMNVAINEVLSCCIDASRRAAAAIRDCYYKRNECVQYKSSIADPVTIADLQSQSLISTLLRSQWPSIAIVGEENSSSLPRPKAVESPCLTLVPPNDLSFPIEDLVIYIDPLDGTRDYCDGFVHNVTVLIGIVANERPVAGVICYPFVRDSSDDNLDQLIWGGPAFGLHGLTKQPPPDSGEICVIGSTHDHHKYDTKKYLDLFAPSRFIKTSGMGGKLIQLIRGDFNLVVSSPLHPSCKWDICAGEALLMGCGGLLTGMNGETYTYPKDKTLPMKNTLGVLAYFPEYSQQFVDRHLRNVAQLSPS